MTDWRTWSTLPEWKVFEGVVLSFDLDPSSVEHYVGTSPPTELRLGAQARLANSIRIAPEEFLEIDARFDREEFHKRWDTSRRRFPGETVHPAQFAAWAVTCGWPVPDELRKLAGTTPVPQRWPWGEHSTKLLGDLAAAAAKFWKPYDPLDASSAPTNPQVIDWLMKHRHVSKSVAEVMAQILRPDGLPAGSRQ